MTDIHTMDLLATLQKVEQRGALETADRVLMLARQVWTYWLPTTDAKQRNITEGLKARLTPYRGTVFAAIIDPVGMGSLMRAIKGSKGGPIVRTALYVLEFGKVQSWYGLKRAHAPCWLTNEILIGRSLKPT